jgi:hypothetical protein
MAIGHGPYDDGDAGFILMDQRKALHTQNLN